MKTPRILILDHFNAHGGAQEYAIDIARYLTLMHIIVYLTRIDLKSLKNLAENTPQTPFSILASNPKSLSFWISFLQNIFQIRSFAKTNMINIFHCNSIPTILLARLARKNQEIVYTYHISHPSKIKKFIIEHFVDSIIYVSQAMKNEVCNEVTDRPSEVIYNGLFPFTPEIKSENLEKIIFGLPGRITEAKGVILFINAAKKILQSFSNIEFHIIGNFENLEFQHKILSLISDTPQIKIIPFFEEKSKLYGTIDVIVNSTIISEPLGRTLIEAGIAKKPVIAPNYGGPIEIVKNLESGILFEASNLESLTRAMTFYILNPEKMMQFGACGFQIFNEKFSIQSITLQILNFYKSRLNSK